MRYTIFLLTFLLTCQAKLRDPRRENQHADVNLLLQDLELRIASSYQSQLSALEQMFQEKLDNMQAQIDHLRIIDEKPVDNKRRLRLVSTNPLAKMLACVSPRSTGKDLIFEGCNIHIRNQQGETETHNGLGNLIIGYNEGKDGLVRTGSHNLVVGSMHTYSSYGGIVAGDQNEISGPFAAVTGGSQNVASGNGSSIIGGRLNQAQGMYSSIVGGRGNIAKGRLSTILGGKQLDR